MAMAKPITLTTADMSIGLGFHLLGHFFSLGFLVSF